MPPPLTSSSFSSQQSQPWLSTPISTEETNQHLSISCEIWWNKFQCNRSAKLHVCGMVCVCASARVVWCAVVCVCVCAYMHEDAWRGCLCTCVCRHVNAEGQAWVSISISLSLNLEVAISWGRLGCLASLRDLIFQAGITDTRYYTWLFPLRTTDAIQFLLLVWWALSQPNHLHGLGC